MIQPINKHALPKSPRKKRDKYEKDMARRGVRLIWPRSKGEQMWLNAAVKGKCPGVEYLCHRKGDMRIRRFYVYSREDKAKMWGLLREDGRWIWQDNVRHARFKGKEYLGCYYNYFTTGVVAKGIE